MKQSYNLYSYSPVKDSSYRFFRLLLKILVGLLSSLGFLIVIILLFFYIQGQRVAISFDEEMVDSLSLFMQQFLEKDIANAIMIKVPLEPGITLDQASKSIKSYSKHSNLELLESHLLHQYMKLQPGETTRFTEIFEFCNKEMVLTLLRYNSDFASYLPHRIALYEDNNGQAWLATLNLELLIRGTRHADVETRLQLLKIQDELLKIMSTGANGIL
ncbi:MAG: hypothetical protein BWK79_01580 [Beggiatoa sp. IS2]|nr:MAG: hypothetical protein BWK79_01580 [Beggiatoa sp. IS2]